MVNPQDAFMLNSHQMLIPRILYVANFHDVPQCELDDGVNYIVFAILVNTKNKLKTICNFSDADIQSVSSNNAQENKHEKVLYRSNPNRNRDVAMW